MGIANDPVSTEMVYLIRTLLLFDSLTLNIIS
jgi:hypothetical protein